MNTKIKFATLLSTFIFMLIIFACVKNNNIEVNPSITKNALNSRSASIYYGNDIKIEVDDSGTIPIIVRTSLSLNSTGPAKLYDLTSSVISGGYMTFDAGSTYWLIPFNPNIAAMVVSNPPTCTTTNCTGTCEMENVGGCLECKCGGGGSGDCDMTPAYYVSHGGVLLKSASTPVVIDN